MHAIRRMENIVSAFMKFFRSQIFLFDLKSGTVYLTVCQGKIKPLRMYLSFWFFKKNMHGTGI